MANHVMFRADNMAGTTQGKYLVSLRMASDMDNGLIVGVGEYEAGAREVKACAAITAETKVGAIAILGSEEVDKEKSFDTVGEFTNKNNTIARGYIFEHGDCFSVTAGAFDEAAPEAGDTVFAKAGSNKMHAEGDTEEGDIELGKCEAVEVEGATTWYVIRIA